jgi:uncharacterized membrane protein YeaQ/YmgE (transglycosylase-associated protein family)
MGVLVWILIGVIGGIAASAITRRNNPTGYFVNIVIGVIGAFAGGFTANLVTRNPTFGLSWASFFVAILGALVFLAVANAVQQR